jgi:hypothetical protein
MSGGVWRACRLEGSLRLCGLPDRDSAAASGAYQTATPSASARTGAWRRRACTTAYPAQRTTHPVPRGRTSTANHPSRGTAHRRTDHPAGRRRVRHRGGSSVPQHGRSSVDPMPAMPHATARRRAGDEDRCAGGSTRAAPRWTGLARRPWVTGRRRVRDHGATLQGGPADGAPHVGWRDDAADPSALAFVGAAVERAACGPAACNEVAVGRRRPGPAISLHGANADGRRPIRRTWVGRQATAARR